MLLPLYVRSTIGYGDTYVNEFGELYVRVDEAKSKEHLKHRKNYYPYKKYLPIIPIAPHVPFIKHVERAVNGTYITLGTSKNNNTIVVVLGNLRQTAYMPPYNGWGAYTDNIIAANTYWRYLEVLYEEYLQNEAS